MYGHRDRFSVRTPFFWCQRIKKYLPRPPSQANHSASSQRPQPLPSIPPAPPATQAATSASLTLQIRLHDSSDATADEERLRETFRIVRDNPGKHPTYLTVDAVGERVTLQLPDCDASWAVVEQLKRHLVEHGDAELQSATAAIAGA